MHLVCEVPACLIQDEPGARPCFSYKMSLEERSRMLGVDHQRASTREVEPGTDAGVFGWQRRGSVRRAEPGGGVRLGEPDVAAATLRGVEAEWPWPGAAISGEDDGVEPSANHASGEDVRGGGGNEPQAVSATAVCAAVHPRRYRVIGGGG